ncbi:hypothetical protein [Natronomonas marina]|jgi:hypothetical protein|uniref:hypothetical protein n=1 Tax=Natronomonas marina TaxID=2961939 RepID=UPI0020CA18DB|nr:hypothetical protein [Natronomonas marina]
MTDTSPRSGGGSPVATAAIPIAVAPFGYLLGALFVVHLGLSEARAVWLTTVLLTSLALAGYAWRSDDGP